MLAIVDLWGALLVPMLFGDARALEVKTANTLEDPSQTLCGLTSRRYLLVEVSADQVAVQDRNEASVHVVARGRGAPIDRGAVAKVLGAYQTAAFGAPLELLLAPDDRRGRVVYEDIVAVVDAAYAAGFATPRLTTLEDLEDHRDVGAGISVEDY
jgi:hypothetical protein